MTGYNFYPRYAFIESITNSLYAVVTFTEDHDFTNGEIVSFRVTKDFGMYEINNVSGKVLNHDATSIVVNIDTTTWTPFSLSMLNQPGTSPPICVPSSSGVVPYENVPQTNLEDAFDNRRT